jgi:hypothetical protein
METRNTYKIVVRQSEKNNNFGMQSSRCICHCALSQDMETRNTYKIVVRQSEKKNNFGMHSLRCICHCALSQDMETWNTYKIVVRKSEKNNLENVGIHYLGCICHCALNEMCACGLNLSATWYWPMRGYWPMRWYCKWGNNWLGVLKLRTMRSGWATLNFKEV